jgi:hypothetical protein
VYQEHLANVANAVMFGIHDVFFPNENKEMIQYLLKSWRRRLGSTEQKMHPMSLENEKHTILPMALHGWLQMAHQCGGDRINS